MSGGGYSSEKTAVATKHHVEMAKVIPFAAEKVWGEMRDFIGQAKHFNLKFTHVNPEEAASDAVGCKRAAATDGEGEPMYEICTAHSDAERTFGITVQEPNQFGITDYGGVVKVTPLTDGSSLAQFKGDFNGPDLLPGVFSGVYTTFFGSIASTLEGGSAVKVEKVGPDALTAGRLVGKVAVVTGGASGLGEATCKALSGEGATTVVVDRDAEAARKTAASLPGGHFAVLDVTKVKDVVSLLEDTVPALCGRLDIVVNNAGITGAQVPTHEHPIENWTAVMNVNMNGAFYVLRSALAQMKKQEPQGGVVVNMSSVVGMQGHGNLAPYTAAKAALIGLTQSTAVEYAKNGIRVCAVAPTVTRTPLVDGFMKSADPTIAAGMLQYNPMPGMPVPEDVANAVLFLTSDDAKWVSGSVLPVDGAYLAGSCKPHSRG